jgi:uncharacterized protein YecE (DUF72 family)
MKRLFIGTSGWHYKHWFGRFYPKGMPAIEHLPYYAKFFDTVELNGVFYRLPTPEMVKSWYARAPKQFTFAYKASRYITHMKRLLQPQSALRLMFRRADLLKEKLGPILYQLPPSFKVDVKRLQSFLKILPKGYDHVMEFRHPTWFTEEVYDVLRTHKTTLCLYDMKGVPTPRVITASVIYVRMHGSESKYAGSYTQPVLEEWAKLFRQWVQQKHPVYMYFNNDIRGHAIENAKTIKGLL